MFYDDFTIHNLIKNNKPLIFVLVLKGSPFSPDGLVCDQEQISFQMPLAPEDPRDGSSCAEATVELEIYNPINNMLIIDLKNVGDTEEDISITRIDAITGAHEGILSPTRFHTGEQRQISHNTSDWQVGLHVLQITYGDALLTERIVKQ